MARILVIEDNPDNYELVRFVLERSGHEVVPAFDGRAGLDAAAEIEPDLILLDLAIPEVDGWEAARRLKADDGTKAIPLVALTAHTLPGDRRRALEAGCDGYISKPIDVKTFANVISHYLNSENLGE
ncbi:MAG: response regulator [Chloroflexi bacterium]|nr:MAG: response regulator [Chloroflexota bacterium]MBL1192910.1 response regulator [Chloroflexota bacterium]NOH10203.1 response regulator [Chloroflexota bacterium]